MKTTMTLLFVSIVLPFSVCAQTVTATGDTEKTEEKKFASRLTGIIKSPKPAWEIKYISQQKKSCRNK